MSTLSRQSLVQDKDRADLKELRFELSCFTARLLDPTRLNALSFYALVIYLGFDYSLHGTPFNIINLVGPEERGRRPSLSPYHSRSQKT